MNRRDWMKTLGSCWRAERSVARRRRAPGSCEHAAPAECLALTRLETEIVRLKLRHTWTTTMSSSAYRDTLQVRYTRDGITGHGEGAPIVRYQENAAGAQQAAESVRDLVTAADPWAVRKAARGNRSSPRGAIRSQSRSRHRADGLGGPESWAYRCIAISASTPTTLPSPLSPLGSIRRKSRAKRCARRKPFPVLKIKVGLDTDEATIAAVRSVTNKPLRVDANEGWKDKEEAVRKINWLATQGVEFVEQPMPAEMLEETRWVHERVHLPLIADEACQRASDIPKLVGIFDGVNVKLDKSGGMLEAFKMIQMARALGLQDHAGLHGLELRQRHRRRSPLAPGRLRRPGRESADRQRSLCGS